MPLNFSEKSLQDSLFRNLVFNLGMAELVSYWKTACSPSVIIAAGFLDQEQLAFWKKLYRQGLGEFFHVNGIIPDDDFIQFTINSSETFEKSNNPASGADKVMVPVGGGKDSVVTLELLSKQLDCVPFIMNPRPASLETALNAGYNVEQILTSERTIDKNLLKLNEMGYLNGHTPFSSVLAFTAFLIAYLHRIPEIALSNESSANEPTVQGTQINHQYSKSLEFENDLRAYVDKYITSDINYFSFLRPLNELQIAELFAGLPSHHMSFRSCNVGSKTNTWCGECPKCLFTFIMLSPFIEHTKLVSIFGRDLLDDGKLAGQLDQLCGLADEKPFECIGTIDEVRAALNRTVLQFSGHDLPALLHHYISTGLFSPDDETALSSLLMSFSPHNIPSVRYVNILKSAIYDH